MKKHTYEQPQFEVLGIRMEQGFAATGISTTSSAGGDYIRDESDSYDF